MRVYSIETVPALDTDIILGMLNTDIILGM